MVVGLELFRERFRSFQGSFVLIGGAACDDWFGRQRLPFRATKDLDIVLLAEALDETFVREMRRFVSDGGYRIRQRSTGTPELYRFAEPSSPDYPAEIELFSRSAGRLDLEPGEIVPVVVAPDHHSLSAILLHDAYYDLVRQQHDVIDGLAIANAASLIPLKAYAWLDLTRRLSQGEQRPQTGFRDLSSRARHSDACFRAASFPKSNFDNGFRVLRSRVSSCGDRLNCCPIAPSMARPQHGAHPRRLGRRHTAQSYESSWIVDGRQ
jgi:hypothetical protein